jgi:hypothetical protein
VVVANDATASATKVTIAGDIYVEDTVADHGIRVTSSGIRAEAVITPFTIEALSSGGITLETNGDGANINGNTAITGDLSVSGATTFSSGASVTGDLSVSGNLTDAVIDGGTF